MIYKLCSHVGCNESIPITERYCERHKGDAANQKAITRVQYETVRRVRDAELIAFYNSPEWLALKSFILNKYKGLCLWSYYQEHKTVAVSIEVHHIVSVKANWNMRLDPKNLIPLNHNVHNMVEAIYRRNNQELKVMQAQLLGLLRSWEREFNTQGG